MLSVAYLLLPIIGAPRTTLDSDEIFTLAISRIGTLHGIWQALLAGGDGNPPLQFIATHALLRLFGEGLTVLRLPSILGFWCMALCLHRWLARRFPSRLALAGALFPLVTAARTVPLEARAYGLMLGFCALTLTSWQKATAGGQRVFALAGMAFGLAAGIFSHFYAILILVPILGGELIRSLHRKSLDYPLWISVIVGLAPGLFLLPLMRAGHRFAEHFWAPPFLGSIPLAYETLLGGPAVLSLLLIAACASAFVGREWSLSSGPRRATPLPPHELAATLLLSGMPFLVGIASLYTKAYAPKYPIVAVLGIATLVVLLAAFFQGDRNSLGTVMIACFLGVASVQFVHSDLHWRSPAQSANSLHPDGWQGAFRLPSSLDTGSLNVVISDSHTFLTLTHYADQGLKQRIFYLTDPAAAVRYSGFDTDELVLTAQRRWTNWKVESYQTFIEHNPRFLVYTNEGWLIPKLLADHATIQVLGVFEDEYLYRVTSPGTGNQAAP